MTTSTGTFSPICLRFLTYYRLPAPTICKEIQGAYCKHFLIRTSARRYFGTLYGNKIPNPLSAIKQVILNESQMIWPQARLASSYLPIQGLPYVEINGALFT